MNFVIIQVRKKLRVGFIRSRPVPTRRRIFLYPAISVRLSEKGYKNKRTKKVNGFRSDEIAEQAIKDRTTLRTVRPYGLYALMDCMPLGTLRPHELTSLRTVRPYELYALKDSTPLRTVRP